MSDLVRINTTIYSWESLLFSVDGIPWNGLNAVDTEQKRERKVVYGMKRDGRPLGKTAGKYSVPTCGFKMLVDSYDELTDFLTVKGLGSYGDAEFTITIQAIEPVAGIPLILVCENCTIDGEKDSYAEGSDELAVEIEIGCLQMTRNGKRLWSVARSIG